MSHPNATLHAVDRDPFIRSTLVEAARSERASVEFHATAADFLAAWRVGEPGCLVIDIDVLGDGVYPAFDFACVRPAVLSIVALSAKATASLAVRTLKAGAFDFVEKPCATDYLIETVRAALLVAQQTFHERRERGDFEKRLSQLTVRQQQILHHLVLGKPNKVIAYELGISERTVEVHRYRVLRRMSVGSAVELARMVGAFAESFAPLRSVPVGLRAAVM